MRPQYSTELPADSMLPGSEWHSVGPPTEKDLAELFVRTRVVKIRSEINGKHRQTLTFMMSMSVGSMNDLNLSLSRITAFFSSLRLCLKALLSIKPSSPGNRHQYT